jgi:thiol-disulfide isomerase/thioredoxin
MKNAFIVLVSILLSTTACQKHPQENIALSGNIKNSTDSLFTISSQAGLLKTIKINNNGTFKDTLTVKEKEVFSFQIGQKRGPIYLENGYDLVLTANADDFPKSLVYAGKGSENNNFILAQGLEMQKIGNPSAIFALEKEDFLLKITTINNGFLQIFENHTEIDSALVKKYEQQLEQISTYFEENYKNQHAAIATKSEFEINIKKGNPSPKFVNYENAKGGLKSLDSFKGKFVYIDIWATWCGPCIREIPSLKELEKNYHNKNIVFVSISTDAANRNSGSWEKANENWKKFVIQRQLSGVQLWAGKDYSFQQAYQINSIPRFILIDPNGKIVDQNAPRPSDPRLIELFNELKI